MKLLQSRSRRGIQGVVLLCGLAVGLAELGILGRPAAGATQVVFQELGNPTTNSGIGIRGISQDGTTLVGSTMHAVSWSASQGWTDLGVLGGTNSSADAVSRDGSVIVGESNISSSMSHAYLWTAATGMQDLSTLGGTWSAAERVSADGSTVMGESTLPGNGVQNGFVWTHDGGMTQLPTLGGTYVHPYAISGTGSAIVGESMITGDTQSHAFRWSTDGGMQDLGTLGGTYSHAASISADGTIVSGVAGIAGDDGHIFRWTAGGMADLGKFGLSLSQFIGMSTDGSVIAGSGWESDNTPHLFRWTASSGMQDLGSMGFSFDGPSPSELSPNGQYLVGTLTTKSWQSDPFFWSTDTGMLDIVADLQAGGVDVGDMRNWQVGGVTNDGVVFGTAWDSDTGITTLWSVSGLDASSSVPEPASLSILGVSLLALLTKRRLVS